MKFGGILGVTVLLVLIYWLQWPVLEKNIKKVKMAFLSIMIVNWVLAVLLVIFPEMPVLGKWLISSISHLSRFGK